ncbi:MAG: efflux RND transporter periplasmic adaptor subunit [Rhodocyclaceae bacterium]
MRHLLLRPLRILPLTLPLILLLTAGTAGAAETASALPVIPLSAVQAKALGVETQALLAAGAGLDDGLPAQVLVPNEQLRVVAAPLDGLIVQIDVAAGQRVRKGQPLARLASPSLLAIERDYLQAGQQARLATQAARRDEQLFAEGIIAEARYQSSRSAQQQAALALRARQQELRLAGIPDSALAALQKNQSLPGEVAIIAPLDGVVLEQSVQAGQRVEAASPLFKVGQLSPLWLEIQVPAKHSLQLYEGLSVLVPAAGASGKVINIGRQINPASQTISVRARIDTGTRKLLPGQMVEATLSIPSDGAAFHAGLASVVHVDKQPFVFVAEGKGFRPLAVKATAQADQRVLLESPALGPGTRIAVKGLAALKSLWLAEKDQKAD